ncbi:DUF5044 domain-containing protein [Paenibacillus sp. J2TS4]|uniref:DUF5044 domain-containing protein n=1 Tax=Paenibacillus sp. J2TS4 TaxID=2807194 RepID=UPI001B00E549|nr:DUF5044 domain-containing protein [Paenibacillus sp. J2TS4]GIP31227.1 hypothetical protein J2TS4_04370 [Paenibacillus sp. J2TS4]
MNKRRARITVEWILAVVLLVVYIKVDYSAYGSFQARQAHEQSERSYHYGPSEIVREIDFDNVKIYLGTYKQWFSANTVIKRGLRWYPGGGVGGTQIDPSEQVNYHWSVSQINDRLRLALWNGYVSDPTITTVTMEVEVNEKTGSAASHDSSKKEVWEQPIIDDSMFVFVWNEEETAYSVKYLRGLDKDGKVVYEKAF